MIRLKHVKLRNICQHTQLDADIDVGLTAITARNAAGKSNLLRAIVYGLTGFVDGLWGSQSGLQQDGAVTPGYVELTLARTDGDDLTLRRYAAAAKTGTQDLLTDSSGKVL